MSCLLILDRFGNALRSLSVGPEEVCAYVPGYGSVYGDRGNTGWTHGRSTRSSTSTAKRSGSGSSRATTGSNANSPPS